MRVNIAVYVDLDDMKAEDSLANWLEVLEKDADAEFNVDDLDEEGIWEAVAIVVAYEFISSGDYSDWCEFRGSTATG